MKIVYLVHQFYPEFQAGTERFVYNTAFMTQNNGHKVRVLSYSMEDVSNFRIPERGVLIRDFVYKGVPVTAFRYQKEQIDLNFSLEESCAVEFAQKWLKNEAPDIVHVGHAMRVVPFIHATRMLGIPYIVTATDFFFICPKVILAPNRDTLCSGPNNGETCLHLCPEFNKELISKRLHIGFEILQQAKAVVTPSVFAQKIFSKEVPGLKPLVNNHGIRSSNIDRNIRFYNEGDALKFGYLGNLAYHKGVHILIKAFTLLSDEDARLILFGSGEKKYVSYLKSLASGDNRIKFMGVFSEMDLKRIFKQIDVLVVPSICYETYSFVVHEALMANIPVIVSDLGGMTEKVKPGINGHAFRAGDVDGLAQNLIDLSLNPMKLNDLKKNIYYHTYVPNIEQENYFYWRLYRH